MAPLSSVLCAVDFSNHSRLAIRAAATLAARQQVRLRLLHVIDMLLAEAAAVAYDEVHLRRAAEEDLEKFAAEECASAGIRIERILEVRIGRPDREIVEAAEEHDAGVIVLGTHGLGGFRKLFFGSVTERVLRKASTPVLAVPLDERHHASPAPYTVTGVLAALDVDETALPLAMAAQQVAVTLGASLTLVHAVAPLQAIGAWASPFEQELPVRLERARNSLTLIAQVLDRHHPPAVIVRSGTPADEIADVAASMDDLVIVVGLGGGWMLHRPGSTAYRVLCLSTVPVLALPPEAIAKLTASVPATTTTTTT
jgi:nucleotide-binding universal stress UspA family protein